MKFISMFFASMRMARELERTGFTAGPENTQNRIDELCGDDHSVAPAGEDNTVTQRSTPLPA